MAVYRVDWPYIRDNLLDLTADPANKEIIILPVGGKEILASVVGDRLSWQATYRTGGYDYADWDTVEAIGAAVIAGLLDGVMLSDLLAELQDIENAVYATACCTPGAGLDYEIIGTPVDGGAADLTVGAGDVPDAFAANPLADYDSSGVVDWTDYSVYLCDAAYRLAAGLDDVLDVMQFATTFDAFAIARQVAAEVVKKLFPGVLDDVFLITWEAFYTLVDNIGAWLTGTPTPADWTTIRSNWDGGVRQQVLCHIAEAATADTAAADVRADMQSLFSSASWDAIWTIYPFGSILREVFQGAQAYAGPPQDCECDVPTFTDFEIVRITDATWTNGPLESGEAITATDNGNGDWTVALQAGGWPAFGGSFSWPARPASLVGYYVKVNDVSYEGTTDAYARCIASSTQVNVTLDTFPADGPEDVVNMSELDAGAEGTWSTDFQTWFNGRTSHGKDYDNAQHTSGFNINHRRNDGTYTAGTLTVNVTLYAIQSI